MSGAPLNTPQNSPRNTPEVIRARELLGAAVVGALNDAERAELLALQSGLVKQGVNMTALAEEVELSIGEAIAAMTPGKAQPAMPAAARDRLAALGERMVSTPSTAAVPFPGRSGASGGGVLGWTVAAAAALVATFGWIRTPPTRYIEPPTIPVSQRRAELMRSTDTMVLSWSAGNDPSGKEVKGDIVWNNGKQEGYIRLQGAPRNDPSQEQYQFWIFDGKREKFPIDGGVFDVASQQAVDPVSGDVIIPINAKLRVFDPTLFAVTREQPAGVVVTDQKRILVVAKPETPAPPPDQGKK